MIHELNERSRTIFRVIVDSYLNTGDPVGSRTIAKSGAIQLSPASIRNTMADLEDAGLLFSAHTSAGRIPTDQGLRLYIDGLMQIGNLEAEERKRIEAMSAAAGRPIENLLEETSSLLSGLSSCASLVISPKMDKALRQIQLVQLDPQRILVIMVMENGMVENRMMDVETPISQDALIAAGNYLNARIKGKTLDEAKTEILNEIANNETQLDQITQNLVERGLALPANNEGHIIIRGQSKLLEDVKAIEDLERARTLLGYLEEQKNMLELLSAVNSAEGVQIFIGTENKIFDQSGWSLVISPYRNNQEQIVGAIGVIGPTRLNYDRIIPMVDFTSQVIGKMMEDL